MRFLITQRHIVAGEVARQITLILTHGGKWGRLFRGAFGGASLEPTEDATLVRLGGRGARKIGLVLGRRLLPAIAAVRIGSLIMVKGH